MRRRPNDLSLSLLPFESISCRAQAVAAGQEFGRRTGLFYARQGDGRSSAFANIRRFEDLIPVAWRKTWINSAFRSARKRTKPLTMGDVGMTVEEETK